MGVASAVSGGLGIINGISGMIQGAKEQREAKQALDNYQRQQLENVANGLQVSTLGSDLQREEQARLASSQVQTARDSGLRGMIGSLGRIEAGNQAVMAKTGADLDMQQKQIDQIQAEDDARIRAIKENREIADINALSSQYQAGKNDKNMAMGNLIQGVGMFGGLGRKSGTREPEYPIDNSLSQQPVTTPAVITAQNPGNSPLAYPQAIQGGYGMFNRYNPYATQNY